MNVEIGLWPKFENWKKIHKKKEKEKTNGIWTLELWNNLQETITPNLVLKKKNKVREVKNWNFEFKLFSATLKFEPYTNCFEGLEDKNQNQEL